jgi:hypothetical protein
MITCRLVKLRGDCSITTILFADNQLLLAGNEDDLQRATTKLNEVMKEYSMKILSRKNKNDGSAWMQSKKGENYDRQRRYGTGVCIQIFGLEDIE